MSNELIEAIKAHEQDQDDAWFEGYEQGWIDAHKRFDSILKAAKKQLGVTD